MKALFPQDAVRRQLPARGGPAHRDGGDRLSVLPVASLQAMAQDGSAKGGAIEKKDLKIGFIPITCATPLIMAHPLGFYSKQGLNVEVVKTAGWALIRDKMLNKEYDATHFLSPMPLAISMGAGLERDADERGHDPEHQRPGDHAQRSSTRTSATRRTGRASSSPCPSSTRCTTSCCATTWRKRGSIRTSDIQIRVVPPPEMVANLRAGNIDGFLGPDPFNQRAVFEEVGFIHLLTKELWNGHPCCAFGTSTEFIQKNPNTFAALYRAVLTAAAMARKPENRELIAKVISPQAYLNQPETVVAQVLTGKFADGLGNVKNVPDRADFDPIPWQSMAVWMLTQMKRWGYVKGDVNYKQIAEKVFLLTDAKKTMKSLDMKVPDGAYPKFTIMGKVFDPEKADAYVASFAIKRT